MKSLWSVSVTMNTWKKSAITDGPIRCRPVASPAASESSSWLKSTSSTPVLPGVDTCFMGVTEERGVWTERCQGCGHLHPGPYRRNMSCFPMRQKTFQRPLRRIDQRTL